MEQIQRNGICMESPNHSQHHDFSLVTSAIPFLADLLKNADTTGAKLKGTHPTVSLRSPRGHMVKGRARYRPIDDRACYWANFFLDDVWEVELRKFSETKRKEYCPD